jgi:chromosomal replication initiation ATPase DnaA
MLQLLREIWARVQGELRSRAGDSAYEHWLAELKPLAIERGVCLFEARNRMICDRVQRLFQPLLEELLSVEFGTRIGVQAMPAPESLAPDRLEVGPQHPVVDDSNRTAVLVLTSLLEERPLPGRIFVLHGPSEVGKTFLIQWWGGLAARKPKVLAGETLLHTFQAAMRDRRLPELRDELCEDRPLVLDELHRVAGHHRIQQELAGLLARRAGLEQPVLIGSRHHPQAIWRSEPALVSHLMSGFLCRIDYPGPAARLAYLRALEGSASRNGRATAIETLASGARRSFSELRRAWLLERKGHPAGAHLRLIDPGTVFRRLLARVAERLELAPADLLGSRRGRQLDFARQALCWLATQEGLSQAEIGRYLGGRSRAGVNYMLKSLGQRIATDEECRDRVERLL